MIHPRWTPKPTLVGDLALPRPLTRDDADDMAISSVTPTCEDSRSVSSTSEIGKQPVQATDALRDWYGSRAMADERLDLAVVDKTTGRLVGEVALTEYEAEIRAANFRTLIDPEGRGKELGTEAARLVIGSGFEILGLHRVTLDVFACNPRARRVSEKVGFFTEGVKRDAFIFDGESVDEVWMSILEDEWTAHRGHPVSRSAGAKLPHPGNCAPLSSEHSAIHGAPGSRGISR